MRRRARLIAWETSVVLMVLKGETSHGVDVLDAARQLMTDAEQGKVSIVLSQAVFGELLPKDDGVLEQFEAWVQHPSITVADVTRPIAKQAAVLRKQALGQGSDKALSLADAFHAATALHFGAAEFHCCDVRLTNALARVGFGLPVKKPELSQLTLVGRFAEADSAEAVVSRDDE